MSARWLIPILLATAPLGLRAADLWEAPARPTEKRLAAYARDIARLHAEFLRSKKAWSEADLRERVTKKHGDLAKSFEKIADPAVRAQVLGELALLHAELAWSEAIAPLREEIARLDPAGAQRLGHFAESEHCFARVVGADEHYAADAVRLAEAAHAGYAKLFGIETVSKVPGKKIRVLIHVDGAHEKPRLYFHPSPPFHSELRYEVPDEKHLTLEGKQRIVYGFCHELGHMVAMWGEYPKIEDDKHAWAHYTGSLVVEHIYDTLGDEPWPTWTAFQRRASGKARLDRQIAGATPGRGSYEAILALFTQIGETFGTEIYGQCFTLLAEKKRIRRVSRVPYLWLDDLRDALLAIVEKEQRKQVLDLFVD